MKSKEEIRELLNSVEGDQVTPGELEDVFGYLLAGENTILIDLELPPDTIGGITIPQEYRKDRQTGATNGVIIQITDKAKEDLESRPFLKARNICVKPGDVVLFSVMAPMPAGLSVDGLPVLPTDKNRYSGVSIIHSHDVTGFISK